MIEIKTIIWKWTLRKNLLISLFVLLLRAHICGAIIIQNYRESMTNINSDNNYKKLINIRKPGVVKLAVIAPADSNHEQSLPRILPAVTLAVKAVSSSKGPLPGWTINVSHRDSKCSSTHGSLAAFDFYINRTAGHFSKTNINLIFLKFQLNFLLIFNTNHGQSFKKKKFQTF